MRYIIAALASAFALGTNADAFSLAWTHSPSPKATGYHIYHGVAGKETNRTTVARVEEIPLVGAYGASYGGTTFFYGTSRDDEGNESEASAVLNYEPRTPETFGPPKPVSLAPISTRAFEPVLPAAIVVSWQHPALDALALVANASNVISTQLVLKLPPTTFTVYRSSTLTNWTALTNVVDTGQVTLEIEPSQTWFFAVTSSNYLWGETRFSEIATAPARALPTGTKIERK